MVRSVFTGRTSELSCTQNETASNGPSNIRIKMENETDKKNKNNKVHGPCAFHLVRSLNTQKTRYACTPRQNQQLQFSINYDF